MSSSSSASSSPFTQAPPPWTAKCTSFLLPFYLSSSRPLPSKAYSPLSASHAPFSSEPECGVFKGGIGMLNLLRYTETPVGSYDELLMMPGNFETPLAVEEGGGKGTGKKAKNMRITVIWVSQKNTCWNGRKNWNIPKHLARFKFTPPSDAPNSSSVPPAKIEVFPEELSATEPFFTAHIKPIRWFPSFPCSFAVASYLGLDPQIVQPPLPEGPTPELCGTDVWRKAKANLHSQKTRIIWIDMKQPSSKSGLASEGSEEHNALLKKTPKDENWWPGLRRWHIGFWFDDATLDFGDGKILTF